MIVTPNDNDEDDDDDDDAVPDVDNEHLYLASFKSNIRFVSMKLRFRFSDRCRQNSCV